MAKTENSFSAFQRSTREKVQVQVDWIRDGIHPDVTCCIEGTFKGLRSTSAVRGKKNENI